MPTVLVTPDLGVAALLTGESGDLAESLERPGPLLERVGARIALEPLG